MEYGSNNFIKTFSIIVLAVVIGVHFYFDFFDFSSTSVEDILSHPTEFINQNVKLKQVSILDWNYQEEGNYYIVLMKVYNGITYFSKPDTSLPNIPVYAKLSKNSLLLTALSKEVHRYIQFDVDIKNGFGILTKNKTYIAESWTEFPYYISLTLLNLFLPLKLSIILSMVIQLIVIAIIVKLVLSGLIMVVPKYE